MAVRHRTNVSIVPRGPPAAAWGISTRVGEATALGMPKRKFVGGPCLIAGPSLFIFKS